MILTLRRTGGFVGFQEVLGTVDTRTLAGEAQRALAGQLQALGRFALRAPGPGADLLRYELEIQEPGQPSRTLTITDEGDPDNPGLLALKALGKMLDLAPI